MTSEIGHYYSKKPYKKELFSGNEGRKKSSFLRSRRTAKLAKPLRLIKSQKKRLFQK